MNALVCVLPVCQRDLQRSLKWIRWARVLSEQPDAWPYELVVYGAKSLDRTALAILNEAIAGWELATLKINPEFYEHPELGYAAMANQMFRSALEMTERFFPGQPTLWCEPDAIPMHPDWMLDIFTEYVTCGKPFMGDFHSHDCAIPHMTGNAVYPANWRELAPGIAALPNPRPEQGWDTLCAHETLPQSHHSFRIQQVWLQPMPPFVEHTRMIHPETVLFHRCKDGTLIDVLAARMGVGPILPDLSHREPAIVVRPRPVPPQITPKSTGLRAHILITSFKRDVEFTSYCLRSIERYAKGFSGVTLMVPSTDARYFNAIPRSVKLKQFDERAGKGFLHHMIQVCRADEICPDADIIVHMDPDCMFWQPSTPADFAPGGKCLLVRESYATVEPRQANRMAWRGCVEAATGITPTHDTMVRHPNVYPRALYGHVRALVEQHTGMDFDSYVFSRENKFPQSFCEYVTLGTVGVKDFPDAFQIVEYDYERDCVECGVTTRRHQYLYRSERDKVVEGFSYNVARYRNDWNKIVRGITPRFYVK